MVPALSIFENVSTGAIDAGYSWMGYEIGQVPAAALFGATPFGLEFDRLPRLDEVPRRARAANETFAPHNVYPIPCGTISPEAAGWFREEITGPEDFTG